MSDKELFLMKERFGHDTLLSLATLDGNRPSVRIVNSYYEDDEKNAKIMSKLRAVFAERYQNEH